MYTRGLLAFLFRLNHATSLSTATLQEANAGVTVIALHKVKNNPFDQCFRAAGAISSKHAAAFA